MSYSYKGLVYSIASPVRSISVNKLNVVVTDKSGPQRFEFSTLKESKAFLAFLYQA